MARVGPGRSAAQTLQNGPPQLSQSWFAWRCSLLFLVARLGKRAADILQSGLAQLFFCFVSSFLLWPKSSKTDRPSFRSWSARLRSLLCRVVRFGLLAAQILQNGPPYTHRHGNLITRELAVGLCPLLSLVVRFGRSAAQILQSGPRQLDLLGCAPCAPSGGQFWPLSSPNPPKRTSPAWSAWLCSLRSLRWSILAAQQPKSSKIDLASLVCLAVLLALPPVVSFGRPAAQILQNGPPGRERDRDPPPALV